MVRKLPAQMLSLPLPTPLLPEKEGGKKDERRMRICVVLCTRAHSPVQLAGSSCPRARSPVRPARPCSWSEPAVQQRLSRQFAALLGLSMSWQCSHRHRYRSRRLSNGQGRQAAGSVILTLSVVGSGSGASFTQRSLDVFRFIPCQCNTSVFSVFVHILHILHILHTLHN
jgi:hypothetical protein